MSRCIKCCLYHFVRNDFSVNQVLMKISASKIKFYILKEAFRGTCLGWVYAGVPRRLDAGPAPLAFPGHHRFLSSEGDRITGPPYPSSCPHHNSRFPVCFLVHRSGQCCSPACAPCGLGEDLQEQPLVRGPDSLRRPCRSRNTFAQLPLLSVLVSAASTCHQRSKLVLNIFLCTF